MRLTELISGCFLGRDNRFRATVEVSGRRVWAHVPNSGRLTELFTPGRRVWLSEESAPHRKTDFDLKLVEYDSTLVSVDARLPNPLLEEAIAAGRVPGYTFDLIEREVTLGNSRLDFRLSNPDEICWLETKSVTLVENGVARFPDAPTGRGRRHLLELVAAHEAGDRAAVFFVVQRSDVERFTPHREADPAFSAALRQAEAAGVEVRAFSCIVTLGDITLGNEVPVDLTLPV